MKIHVWRLFGGMCWLAVAFHSPEICDLGPSWWWFLASGMCIGNAFQFHHPEEPSDE